MSAPVGCGCQYDAGGRVFVDHCVCPVDIVGGTHTDPGDTELDDAIEQIVGDYIPDSLLRAQLASRIVAEVLRRTPIDDPYARPTAPAGDTDA